MTADRPALAAVRQRPVRHLLLPAGVVVAIVLAVAGPIALLGVGETSQRAVGTPLPSADPDGHPFCDGVEAHYALKGTDCRQLPIVTAPGALGPANTGGPAGGIDWVPAYPGSNVWIPGDQISGRLYVRAPLSRIPVPPGYVEIGRTPQGAVLYWRIDPLPS